MLPVTYRNESFSVDSNKTLSSIVKIAILKEKINPRILSIICNIWGDLKINLHNSNIKCKHVVINVNPNEELPQLPQNSDWVSKNMSSKQLDGKLYIAFGCGVDGVNNIEGNNVRSGLLALSAFATNYPTLDSKDKNLVLKSISSALIKNNIPFVKEESGLFNVVPAEGPTGRLIKNELLQGIHDVCINNIAVFGSVHVDTAKESDGDDPNINNIIDESPNKRQRLD